MSEALSLLFQQVDIESEMSDNIAPSERTNQSLKKNRTFSEETSQHSEIDVKSHLLQSD